tara:strand:+ start:295 stop:837 length:543 start_codon:yes stop_codon:yes gene_type:complete
MQDRKLIETLNEFQQEYALLIEQKMVEKKVNASGALSESVALPKISLLGQVYNMQVTMLDYWKQVDGGRGPTTGGGDGAVRRNLEKWLSYQSVQAKIGTPKSSKGTRTAKKSTGEGWTATRIKQAAFFMARNIHQRGTKAKPFLSEAAAEMRPKLVPEITKAVKQDIIYTIDEIEKALKK